MMMIMMVFTSPPESSSLTNQIISGEAFAGWWTTAFLLLYQSLFKLLWRILFIFIFLCFFGGFVQQETLCEMNDELQESARETELELRESLDLATAKTVEANRRLDSMKENIVDYETTINKFRDLVAQLKVRHQPYLQVFDSSETWGRERFICVLVYIT